MIITIDTAAQHLTQNDGANVIECPLYSREAFEILSREWLRVGWNQKYSYTFSWMGLPMIQLPEDVVRLQEVIFRVRPDVIVETGVAHGGSLMLSASLCQAMDHGRVIGVDIDIRPRNRAAIESHPLSSRITLIEGNSIADDVVAQVRSNVRPGEAALVILDSNHTKAHVRAELEAYCQLVTSGSYIVATDGIMRDLYDVPRGHASWKDDHPVAAVAAFIEGHPEFRLEQPRWPFNESHLGENVTHWPDAWLRRL